MLSGLTGTELSDAVSQGDVSRLSPLHRNYVAAMVEQACHEKGVPRPERTAEIALEDLLPG